MESMTQQQKQQQQQNNSGTTPAPLLRYPLGSRVVPGDRIGRIIVDSISDSTTKIKLIPGPGTYIRGGQIYVSIVGTLHGSIIVDQSSSSSNGTTGQQSKATTTTTTTTTTTANSAQLPDSMILSVEPVKGYFAHDEVLHVGQIVLGRIVRIVSNQQQAIVTILAVQHGGTTTNTTTNSNNLLRHPAEGIIRKEDVSKITASTGTDKSLSNNMTMIQNNFRPNDIIIARVLSLGDVRRYYLSTAEPYLGVIYARSSVVGNPAPMIPVSYKEMECPITGVRESRKCAKPPLPVTKIDDEVGKVKTTTET